MSSLVETARSESLPDRQILSAFEKMPLLGTPAIPQTNPPMTPTNCRPVTAVRCRCTGFFCPERNYVRIFFFGSSAFLRVGLGGSSRDATASYTARFWASALESRASELPEPTAKSLPQHDDPGRAANAACAIQRSRPNFVASLSTPQYARSCTPAAERKLRARAARRATPWAEAASPRCLKLAIPSKQASQRAELLALSGIEIHVILERAVRGLERRRQSRFPTWALRRSSASAIATPVVDLNRSREVVLTEGQRQASSRLWKTIAPQSNSTRVEASQIRTLGSSSRLDPGASRRINSFYDKYPSRRIWRRRQVGGRRQASGSSARAFDSARSLGIGIRRTFPTPREFRAARKRLVWALRKRADAQLLRLSSKIGGASF